MNMNQPRIIELIYSEYSRGTGKDNDIIRQIKCMHKKDGTTIIELDPISSEGTYINRDSSWL